MTILTILNYLGGSNVIPKTLKCEERSQEREEVTVMSSENLTIIANSEEGSGGHEPRTVAAFAKKKQSLSSNLQETCSPANTLILAQDRQVMVESSDKMWSPGEGNGKPLQYSYLENPMNSVKAKRYDTER